ncbi:MAG: glycine cleavage system aminomethyltransferase GcvT [Actinomycetota bacterium]
MLKTSPLDAAHREMGAKMGEFGGWDMPISYSGTLVEHAAVRERVGIFDVSHLGKILVEGEGACALLERVLTNRMSDLKVGRSRYAMVCNEAGGIIDDLISYRLADDRIMVVPNASNRDAVMDVLQAHADPSVSLSVLGLTTIAVQGPASKPLIEARWPGVKGSPYTGVIVQDGSIISRTGYTGEWGYEIYTEAEVGLTLWMELVEDVRDRGGEVCGLAARDTLRLEMGYPLHGNDIDQQTTPIEAGLGWAVKLEGRVFPGSVALDAEPRKLLRGLRSLGRSIPRAGCEVFDGDSRIGQVTSGTMSPTLRVGIALAYLDPGFVGDRVEVDVRGKRGAFAVVDPPFVDSSPKRLPEGDR